MPRTKVVELAQEQGRELEVLEEAVAAAVAVAVPEVLGLALGSAQEVGEVVLAQGLALVC